jgi:carotenoid 1,2-hydratase
MKIISGFSEDTQSDKPKPGGYEWWYFDAQSDDGYSVVIIFYDGNPFSRRYIRSIEMNDGKKASDYPAISVSVYKNGKPLFYSFEEFEPEKSFFSGIMPKGETGLNSFEGRTQDNEIIYEVILNQKVANGDQLKGKLYFKSGPFEFGDQAPPALKQTNDHTWNLVMPFCEVSGQLEITGYKNYSINFEGIGYHDHNSGYEPMKESFDEWYWGRYHLNDDTLIYYLMNQRNTWNKKAWLIDKNGRVSEFDELIQITDTGFNSFGLRSARKIELAGSGAKAVLHKDRVIDSGPFYQRFEGRLLIKKGNVIQEGRGISEYIRPDRIYNKLFWPLVNMRIRYPGKPNWVQKSPRLYRWTW